MYYVYILFSLKDRKLYIGFTSRLRHRLKEHFQGKNISTKSGRLFKLVYYETHLSKEDTQRRERYFKATKGKSTIKQVLRNSLCNLKQVS